MRIYFDHDFWRGATQPVRDVMDNPVGLILGGAMMVVCWVFLAPVCIKFKRAA